jgi:hypothetical protein
MIESPLATSHHFYLVFFDTFKDVPLSSLLSLFDAPKDHEKISLLENKKDFVLHFQLELKKAYGIESVLLANRNKKTGGFWYDFYLGKSYESGTTYYYICYPYALLGKYIENAFIDKKVKRVFLKPQVKDVLSYMKKRQTKNRPKIDLHNLQTDIVKYSARVTEESNANRINIIGANPLDSRVFDILNKDDEIQIEPISLKIKCVKEEIGKIEISFDKLGNCRFWLTKDTEEKFSLIPYLLKFYLSIGAIDKSSFISSYSLLEDE